MILVVYEKLMNTANFWWDTAEQELNNLELDRIWVVAPQEGPERNKIFSFGVFSEPFEVFNQIHLELK